MLKFADKNEKELYIYGDQYEVMSLLNQVDLKGTTTYENQPALIVKKEKLEGSKQ